MDDGGTKFIDNPHSRDVSRHIYELIWQAVRDKVRPINCSVLGIS